MVVREFVNQITFKVTGKENALKASENVRKDLERAGVSGRKACEAIGSGFRNVSGAASGAARSVASLSRGIGIAAATGGRNLAPLQRALIGVSAQASAARRSIFNMTTAARAARGLGSLGGGVGRAVSRGAGMARAGIAAIPSVNAVTGLAAALGAYQVKQTADEVMNLDGRLRAVTATDAERLEIEQKIYETSQKNRQSMTAIGDLYTKVARAAKPMGYTNEQSMRVADIVSKALTAGGASTAEAESTILQLGQALQAGTLQGDELASLRENGGTLMQHMAEAMGVTIADLKQMGAEGELTSERVMNAILAAGSAIDAEFAKMPMTIGQALQKAENRFSRFTLLVEQRTAIFSRTAQAIDSAFDTLEEWVRVTDELAAGPQDGNVDAYLSLAEAHPVLAALANNVFPALRSIGSEILSIADTVADTWAFWGGDTTVPSLLSNVAAILKALWTIAKPFVELFSITLVSALQLALKLLNLIASVVTPIWDFLAEKIGMISSAAADVGRIFSGQLDPTRAVPSAYQGNSDYSQRNYTFNVNSPAEVNDIMGGPVMSLSPNV